MKRILFSILFCLGSVLAFSQTKNPIFRLNYPIENISNINTDLSAENLNISTYNGSEILVEVSSNNKKLMPQINIQDDVFKVSSSNNDFNKGDNCTISVYVPFNHEILNYYINQRYGALKAENLTATEIIKIDCGEGTPSISNLTCDAFKLSASQNYISINQLDCSYFDISMPAGSVEVNLKNAPLASSSCSIKDGNLTLSLPRTDNFEVQAYTKLGKFINNFTKTTQSTSDYKSYVNGNDGAVIKLQSHSGNITLNP